jgi:hypothetical protein
MGELIKTFQKEKFLELIRSGLLEHEALAALGNFPKPTYTLLLVKDLEYREAVEQAKKDRADVWFQGVVTSVQNNSLTKEDVPVEKLKFEQRKYLAAIDNPDKYAERSKHSLELSVNIFQEMKDLPIAEAKRLLRSADPFAQAVEAEFKEVDEGLRGREIKEVIIDEAEDIFS